MDFEECLEHRCLLSAVRLLRFLVRLCLLNRPVVLEREMFPSAAAHLPRCNYQNQRHGQR